MSWMNKNKVKFEFQLKYGNNTILILGNIIPLQDVH